MYTNSLEKSTTGFFLLDIVTHCNHEIKTLKIAGNTGVR